MGSGLSEGAIPYQKLKQLSLEDQYGKVVKNLTLLKLTETYIDSLSNYF